MKYMVMEVHPAYAVLMDEEARFVRAANLHYEVGQNVESPVLLDTQADPKHAGIRMTVRRCIAAAACVLVLIGAGAAYYRSDVATYSTIVVSAAADIRMNVNSRGMVVSLSSCNAYGDELLADYDGKGKDKRTVASELIARAVEKGYLNAGDTVHFYVDAPKTDDYDTYCAEFEEDAKQLDMSADVQKYSRSETIPAPTETQTDTAAPAQTVPAPAEPPQTELPAAAPIQETTAPAVPETTERTTESTTFTWTKPSGRQPYGWYGDEWNHWSNGWKQTDEAAVEDEEDTEPTEAATERGWYQEWDRGRDFRWYDDDDDDDDVDDDEEDDLPDEPEDAHEDDVDDDDDDNVHDVPSFPEHRGWNAPRSDWEEPATPDFDWDWGGWSYSPCPPEMDCEPVTDPYEPEDADTFDIGEMEEEYND